MPVKLNSSGGGSVTLDVPVTASAFNLTIPALGGSVIASDASGNVGIGTSSPAAKLHVVGNTTARLDGVFALDVRPGASDFSSITWKSTDGATTYANIGPEAVGAGSFWVNGATNIYLATGGTERARITSGGQFTIASQPSFRVSRSNNTGVSGVVLFNNIYHNIGGHYNSGTGRFTAPVTGSYLLTATGGQSSAYGFDIRVNGTTVSRAELVGVSFGYLWETCAVVVRMNANDYADVNVFSGTPQFEPGFGSFTGQLLS